MLPLWDAPVGTGAATPATLVLERYHNALKVFLVRGGDAATAAGTPETKTLIRKVPWVFLDDDALGNDALVGVFAAQPDPDDESGGKSFPVTISNFQVQTTADN